MATSKRKKSSGSARRARSRAERTSPPWTDSLHTALNDALDAIDRFAEDVADAIGLREEPSSRQTRRAKAPRKRR